MSNTYSYLMRRICSWCKRELAPKPVTESADDGKITHTVCPECVAIHFGLITPAEIEDANRLDPALEERQG